MTVSQRGVVRLGTNLVNTYQSGLFFVPKKNSTSSNLSGDILRLQSPASYNLGQYLPVG